jgi:hypothetical protein
MLRRSLAPSLVVALALALPLPTGCTKKPQLTEVAVPEAGVSMRYDLAPGQEYTGHLKMRNSAQTPVGDVITLIEFDAALVVSANEDASGKLVRATVSAIELEMRLPEGIPAEAVGGMTPAAAAGLNGTELHFHLSEHGEVSNESEAPTSAPIEVQAIFGMISGALTSGFVRVPEQPVKDGESWDAKTKQSKVQVKSATHTGTLEGLARNAAGEDIALLAFTAEIEAEREGRTLKMKQDVEASFSTTGGYVVTVKRKVNNEVVGQGTLLSEIEAEWKKGGKQAPTGEVQTITDPCDPDYVGAEECPAEAAPAAAAPAG